MANKSFKLTQRVESNRSSNKKNTKIVFIFKFQVINGLQKGSYQGNISPFECLKKYS